MTAVLAGSPPFQQQSFVQVCSKIQTLTPHPLFTMNSLNFGAKLPVPSIGGRVYDGKVYGRVYDCTAWGRVYDGKVYGSTFSFNGSQWVEVSTVQRDRSTRRSLGCLETFSLTRELSCPGKSRFVRRSVSVIVVANISELLCESYSMLLNLPLYLCQVPLAAASGARCSFSNDINEKEADNAAAATSTFLPLALKMHPYAILLFPPAPPRLFPPSRRQITEILEQRVLLQRLVPLLHAAQDEPASRQSWRGSRANSGEGQQ
jgi:hypothetical protein